MNVYIKAYRERMIYGYSVIDITKTAEEIKEKMVVYGCRYINTTKIVDDVKERLTPPR